MDVRGRTDSAPANATTVIPANAGIPGRAQTSRATRAWDGESCPAVRDEGWTGFGNLTAVTGIRPGGVSKGGTMPQVAVGARSEVGRVRTLNEDAYLEGERVWLVADGMGGHAAGDIASRLAVESLRELDAADLTPARVNAAVARANAVVVGHGRQHPQARGLGTTVTGLAEVRVGGVAHWAVFNVGDSRVYRYADGRLQRTTVDHSEVEELVARGLIADDEARDHPARHVITRSVGMIPAPRVDVWVLPQIPGERFLLCSDGLSSELTDDEIADLLAGHTDPREAASALVEAVLATPARDNVTVVVVDVLGDEAGTGDEATVPHDLRAAPDAEPGLEEEKQ